MGGERELAVVVKVVEEEAVGVDTWTRGTTRPDELRTRVAGTILPLGNMTGMVFVLSGSKVW